MLEHNTMQGLGTFETKEPFEVLEDLMNDLLPLARRLLKEFSEFLPYGGAVASDGELWHLLATAEPDRMETQQHIDLLVAKLRERMRIKQYEAAAIVFRSRPKLPETKEISDAITVHLEHSAGYALRVFFPYRISAFHGLIEEKPFARRMTGSIFRTKNAPLHDGTYVV